MKNSTLPMQHRVALFDRVIRELVALTLNESTNGQTPTGQEAPGGQARPRETSRVTG